MLHHDKQMCACKEFRRSLRSTLKASCELLLNRNVHLGGFVYNELLATLFMAFRTHRPVDQGIDICFATGIVPAGNGRKPAQEA
jgi:hypothetical protein